MAVLLIQCQMQLSFASGSTIEGVVTDAYTNAPIPLAEVNIGTGSNWFERGLGSTRTDANGRYSIQVSISDQYQFIVHAKEIERGQYRFYDHCWSRRTLPHAPVIHADFALEPAGSILVKMFDLNGRPLGANSMEGSWVKDVSLKSIAGEWLDNRTYGHAYQPYRTDDEEMTILSPERLTTVIAVEITVPQHGIQTVGISNGSVGFAMRRGELLVLNLNYEIARTVYGEFSTTFESLLTGAAAWHESASEIGTKLVQAQADHLKDNDASCAAEANVALSWVLSLRDEGWLEIPFTAEHPRLLFTRSDLNAIRQKIKSGFPQQVWKSILNDCDKFLTLPPPQLPPSSSCPAGANDCWYDTADSTIMRMQYLALAYIISGDARYAAKAKDITWALLSWAPWIDPGEEMQVNPGVPDLLAGHITAGVAITYDWLFDYLTAEERDFIRTVVAERGAEPLYQASISGVAWWHDSSHNNHNAITHGGMGLAGLAFLGEHPNASKWVGLAASKIWKYFDSGGKNGGWGEGLHYWAYGLVESVLFADALRRVTKVDLYKSSFLRETPYFPMYLMSPGLERHVNFGDSWLGGVSWVATLMLRLSSEYGNSYGQAFFNMLRDKYGDDTVTGDAMPFALIWYDESVKPKPLDDLPPSRLFEGLGWVVVRSGWGPNAILLAFKSGPNWSHGHADQNNFILEAFGEPLIVDLGAGTYSVGYDNGPTLDYHQASVGHNVILFDGQGQLDPRSGWAQPPNGEIITFQTYPGFESYEYMVGDASAAYSQPVKFIRQIVLVQHRFLLILDTVEAPHPSRFQWLAHTTGELETERNEIRITKGNVLLTMKLLLPENFDSHVYHDQNSQIEWSREEPAPRLEVSTQEPATTGTFLVVLYPVKSGEAPPKISLIQNATTWIVKVEDNATHYLFFNRTASPPAFLATRSQMASLQQTTQDLLQTASDLLEKAKSEQLESPQAAALVKSGESNYQEAAKANQSGDYERAATRATKSIAELTNAFTVDTSWKQERTQTSILALGITIIALGSAIAFLFYKRRKPKTGKMPRLRGQTL